MKQETVCAIPAELFAVSNSGASTSKGACVCALVVLPSRPAKYTLVCYNAQQVTFCVARMSWVDGRNTSLRLVVAASGHVSFTDDTHQRWTLFFQEEAQQLRFLACVGVAFYDLYGAPATTVYQQDLTLPSSSSLKLEKGDRACVSFTGFELVEKGGVCAAGAMTEQRGHSQDSPPYVFEPRSSAVQLSHGSFGFEGSVAGMREEERRVFVVPAGYTTSVTDAMSHVETQGAVYLVQLLRVEHVQEEAPTAQHSAEAAAPPAVYAATAEADRHGQPETSRALTVANATVTTTVTGAAAATAHAVPSAVPAYLSASGIPAEHMSVLRKVEVGVNAAVSSARDVHDVTAIFAQEWRHVTERPKPSLLSNAALLEQVQRVVAEEETAQAHLDNCDRLLHTLAGRNKELQQRIDRATAESQKLLEGRNTAAAKAMDARLEKDRQLVRLKDAVLLKRQEQEDLQRHVAALQRTVDVLNEELRQVQGKRDIHSVEAASMAERLAAMQETLSEERRRNAALASKKAATEESIKKAQMQLRLAEGRLTTARGLAEKERLRYVQMMEEERHHRAQDSELLRQDILHELDARERQYHVDRQRIAEEQFSRGLRDGKAEGRQAAETDLLGHQDELRLNLQRAKTEVETAKEEVRRSIESAMTLRRTLGGKVAELEEQLASATRKQTEAQYAVAQWQTRCRTVRDTISQHWRTLLTYATHPSSRDDLLRLMAAVRSAEEESYAQGSEEEGGVVRVDLQAQLDAWKESRRASIEQRLAWIASDMTDMYVKGADYHLEHEWLQPVAAAHAATLEAVAQLYSQLHGSRALFDLCVQESRERHDHQQQWWRTIHHIEEWLTAQRTAQDTLKAEESQARQALWEAYVKGGDAVVQLCAAQLRAQVLLLQEEMKARDAVAAEEAAARGRLPADAAEMWAADCAAQLRLYEEEEEAARAGLEAEAYTACSGIKFQFAYAIRGAEEAEMRRVQQEESMTAESVARSSIEYEAAACMRQLLGQAMAVLAPPPPPPPPLTASEEEAPRPVQEVVEAIAPPPATEGAMAPSPVSTASPDRPANPPQLDGGAASPASAEDPPAAPQHVDVATPPPTAPPAPVFTLSDPPRVHRDALEQPSGTLPAPQDTFFSDVPPPLPPSDTDESNEEEEEAKDGATQASPGPRGGVGAESVSAPAAAVQPFRASSSSSRSPARPAVAAAAIYGERDAPPPLPDDGDSSSASNASADMAPPHAAGTREEKAATAKTSAAALAAPAKARAAPSAASRISAIEVDEASADANKDSSASQSPKGSPSSGQRPAAAARGPKYMFGGSSSDEEEEDDEDTDKDDDDDDDDGNGASATGVGRNSGAHRSAGRGGRASRPSPPTAAKRGGGGASAAPAKPKLFESSDDD